MYGHNTTSRRVAAFCAAIWLGLIVAPEVPLAAIGGGDAPAGSLPGDTPVPFWPHETGALAGTSETFVDVRADGSYYDPSLGLRVAGAASRAMRPDELGTPDLISANGFAWGEFALGIGAALVLVLTGLVAAAVVGRKRRHTTGRATA
jgi:hypothetical protein